jgi:hypothetical protein
VLRSEELRDLCRSLTIIRRVKSRGIRWVGHETRLLELARMLGFNTWEQCCCLLYTAPFLFLKMAQSNIEKLSTSHYKVL